MGMSRVSAVDVKSVKRRITVSVLSQLANQLFIGICGVVILKILTNNLGIKQYGVYVTTVAFVSTFSLLTDLGLNTITAREVAKHPKDAAEIISHNMGFRLFLCVVMLPVITGIGFILYPHASRDLRYGILLTSCYLFFDSIWATSGSYFYAEVRSHVGAVISSIQQLLYLGCVVGIAILGWGLFGFLAAFVLTIAIGAVIFLWKVRMYLAVRPKINLKLWRKTFGLSIVVGVISIINLLYLKADNIMISVIKGTSEAGIYGVAYSLVNVFVYLSGYIMGALSPSMAVSNSKDFENIVQKAFHFMVVLSCLLIVGGFLVSHDVVLLVSSRQFVAAANPFAILAAATGFSYINSVFYFASVAVSKQNKLVYIALTTLFVNICLNLLLIPKFGINGAAWATVITESMATVMGYQLFWRQTGVRLKLAVTVRPIIAAGIAFLFTTVLYSHLKTNGALYDCFMIAVSLGGSYFVLLYVMKGLPTEMRTVINRVFSVILRRNIN
jgi:O-antigen/teichoic acid export membrane protein